jgi:cytoplasmic iron level regulating protein YaaA (DUF328/UPF0246 family)
MREAGGSTLVNLASEEYFRAVDVAALRAPVVQPVFQDRRGDAWKVVSSTNPVRMSCDHFCNVASDIGTA